MTKEISPRLKEKSFGEIFSKGLDIVRVMWYNPHIKLREAHTMDTMKFYISYLKANKKSALTISSYTHAINDCLKTVGKDVAEITYIDLLDWQSRVSDKAAATVALYVAAVKSYFGFLKSAEIIGKDPSEKLERPIVRNKQKPYMTAEDVKRIVNAAHSIRDKAIILTIAYTGLRISELTALMVDDYHKAKETHEIVILGKGAKERTIFLNDALVDVVDDYLNSRKQESKYLFCTTSGARVNEQNITKAIKKYAQIAGLPFDVSAHTLRAAFATILGDNGVPVAVISKALGHSSLGVTTRYIRSNQNNVNAAMAAMKI